MVDVARLEIQADSRGVRTAYGDLDRLTRSGADAEGSTKRLTAGFASMQSVLSSLMPLLGGFSAALAVRQMARYSDEWSDLNSRLVNATKSVEGADFAMERISETARRTYSSLKETAQGFLQNNLVLTELGYSTERQLDMMAALNNSLVISGAKGDQASLVMNAFGRAMAQGSLKGQELNLLMNYSSRTVEALAEGLGVTTIQLREMTAAGEVTADRMFKALISQMEKLTREAEEMPATIGDGFLLMNNAILEAVGRMNEAVGAGAAVAQMLTGMADWLGEVNKEIAEGRYQWWFERLTDVSKIIAILIAMRLVAWLAAVAWQTAINIQQTIAYQMALARMAGASLSAGAALTVLGRAMAFLGGPVGVAVGAASLIAWAVSSRDAEAATGELDTTAKGLLETVRELTGANRDNIDTLRTQAQELRNTAIAEIERVEAEIRAQQARLDAARPQGPNAGVTPRYLRELGALGQLNNELAQYRRNLEEANEAARLLRDAPPAVSGTSGSVMNIDQDDVKKRLESLRVSNLTEIQQEREKFSSILETLNLGYATKEMSEKEWHARLEEEYRRHHGRLQDIAGEFIDTDTSGRDEIARRLEAIRVSNLSEVEAEEEKFARILEVKNLAFANGLMNEQQWHAQLEEEHLRHQARLTEATQKQSAARVALEQQVAMQTLGIMQQLGAKSKAFSIAAIAIQAMLAAKKIMIESEVAAMAALVPPPIGLGPVAGMGLAASIRAMGKVSAGLALASGAISIAGLGGGSSSPAPVYQADPITSLPTDRRQTFTRTDSDVAPQVNITIQALDTSDATEVLQRNRGQIVDLVQSSYDRRGASGGPLR